MSVHHVVRNGPGATVNYQDRSLSQALTSEEIGKLLSLSNHAEITALLQPKMIAG